jgi:hypothetical protein
MSDLPQPLPPTNNPIEPGSSSFAAVPTPGQQAQPVSGKMLQTQAVEHIEAAILQTTTNPAERALMIHNIKAGYIKARYGIDVKGSAG